MSEYNLENISPTKKSFQTEKMKVPAILFSKERNFEKSDVLEAVEKIAENENVFHSIAVLSEAHTRPNIKNPTGSIVASRNIIPEMIDAAPNCGMRIILTDLSEKEMSVEKIKKIFDNLRQSMPSKKIIIDKISSNLVSDIFRYGSQAIFNKFPIHTKKELANTFSQGNFFKNKDVSEKETSNAIPKIISWIGRFRLGNLGEIKSHFIYLMRVSSIENENLAKVLGIKDGQYLFFMHTGTSIVGRYTASLYTSRKIKSFSQKIILFLIKLLSFPIQKNDPHKIDTAFRALGNYGFANRTLLTHKIEKSLEKTFERAVSTELLYDAPHVYFDEETHFDQKVIVHRNGANRAFGPSRMTHHAVFSQTGEPVLIAPFAKEIAYIGVGTDQNEETFFSANHEIGKITGLENPKEYAQKIVCEMEKNRIIKLVAKLETVTILSY
ncbi:MAG: RtcB family protein [Parcubacteria group bacterium]|jgi:tRNA-splicing ligase RtcB